MINNWKHIWENLPITKKLFWEIAVIAIALFASNLFIYAQINQMVERMNSVYMSNVNLNELINGLSDVQNNMFKYLQVKDSQSLMDYYRAEQDYRHLLEGLSMEITDNQIHILEKNIRHMSESYLTVTDEAVQAKRGQNVEKYKSSYESALKLYQFINNDVSTLNILQFKNNSASYQTLQAALKYLEVISSIILMVVMIISITVMMMMTKDMVTPLINLAQTAKLVGQGNFHVKVPPVKARDELGIVTDTFNQMVESLERYVKRIKESAEIEREMKEREFLMESHLKEAKLQYLQSQINPHFLFNSLNAGVQLAMMEDAEKTSVFMEKMADFFRYNVKKGSQDATILEELETVENYIYILNVRFAGDIHYQSDIAEESLNYAIPSMILQPLVENAVTHGIRDIDWPGMIRLSVKDREQEVEVCIADNGKGMNEETLLQVCAGKQTAESTESTGIGLSNVISRLKLYYGKEDIFHIFSEGEGKGTTVVLRIPKRGGI
ncbi:histidine kinase [Clostridium sp. HBUAS56010]|uniref:sensor histidine kinase n=1 Tax=Clostridium sp. HBUAS56010 TaxID=2571127 RepID=UPI0011785CF9|nr:histidine kinase [Clostridium sp. HBUAS56010]